MESAGVSSQQMGGAEIRRGVVQLHLENELEGVWNEICLILTVQTLRTYRFTTAKSPHATQAVAGVETVGPATAVVDLVTGSVVTSDADDDLCFVFEDLSSDGRPRWCVRCKSPQERNQWVVDIVSAKALLVASSGQETTSRWRGALTLGHETDDTSFRFNSPLRPDDLRNQEANEIAIDPHQSPSRLAEELREERRRAQRLATDFDAERVRNKALGAVVEELEQQVAQMRHDIHQNEVVLENEKGTAAATVASLQHRVSAQEAALSEMRTQTLTGADDLIAESVLLERNRANELTEALAMESARTATAQHAIQTLETRLQVAMANEQNLIQQWEADRKAHQEYTNVLEQRLTVLEKAAGEAHEAAEAADTEVAVYADKVRLLTEAMEAAGLNTGVQGIENAFESKRAAMARLAQARKSRLASSTGVLSDGFTIGNEKEKQELLTRLRAEERRVAALEAEVALERGMAASSAAELAAVQGTISAQEELVSQAKETSMALVELQKRRQLERTAEQGAWEKERRDLEAQVAAWGERCSAADARAAASEEAMAAELLRARSAEGDNATAQRRITALSGEVEALQLAVRSGSSARQDLETQLATARQELFETRSAAADLSTQHEHRIKELEALTSRLGPGIDGPLLRLKLQALEEQLESEKASTRSAEAEAESLKRMHTEQEIALAKAKDSIASLKLELQSMDVRLSQKQKSVVAISVKASELEEDLASDQADRAVIDEQRRRIDALEREVMDERSQRLLLEDQNGESKMLSQVRKATEELQRLATERRKREDEFAAEREQLLEDVECERLQVASKEARCRRLDAQLERLEAQVLDKGQVGLDQEIGERRAAALQVQLERVEAQHIAAQERIMHLETKLKAATDRVQDLTTSQAVLTKDLALAQRQSTVFETEARRSSQSAMARALQAKEQELALAVTRLDAKEQELRVVSAQLNASIAARGGKEDADSAMEDVVKQVEARNARERQRVGDLELRLRDERARAVAAEDKVVALEALLSAHTEELQLGSDAIDSRLSRIHNEGHRLDLQRNEVSQESAQATERVAENIALNKSVQEQRRALEVSDLQATTFKSQMESKDAELRTARGALAGERQSHAAVLAQMRAHEAELRHRLRSAEEEVRSLSAKSRSDDARVEILQSKLQEIENEKMVLAGRTKALVARAEVAASGKDFALVGEAGMLSRCLKAEEEVAGLRNELSRQGRLASYDQAVELAQRALTENGGNFSPQAGTNAALRAEREQVRILQDKLVVSQEASAAKDLLIGSLKTSGASPPPPLT